MLSGTEAGLHLRVRRGIVEDAEQYERIRGVMLRKVGFFQSEAQRNSRNQRVSKPSHCLHVLQDGLSELRNIGRKQIWSVQRGPGFHNRVVFAEFGPEVNPFLQVRLARCEFTAHRKVSSPRLAAKRHLYFELFLKILREELPAGFLKPLLEMLVHAVVNDIKEP